MAACCGTQGAAPSDLCIVGCKFDVRAWCWAVSMVRTSRSEPSDGLNVSLKCMHPIACMHPDVTVHVALGKYARQPCQVASSATLSQRQCAFHTAHQTMQSPVSITAASYQSAVQASAGQTAACRLARHTPAVLLTQSRDPACSPPQAAAGLSANNCSEVRPAACATDWQLSPAFTW